MHKLPDRIEANALPTALAPMQNVTDHAFFQVVSALGGPDYYFTEYFSVHESYYFDPESLRSITENPTGRPVFAQLLGNHPELLAKATREMSQYPIAGIDLNLGCPAPKIYKRNAGGGLLRNPDLVDSIIGHIRDATDGLFSVKCRLGFDEPDAFESCLESVRRHGVDFLTVHGRTVRQMYRGEVDYQRIRKAAIGVDCPVFANGNLSSARVAEKVIRESECHGAMIGRAAIRNPWIFRQIRERACLEALGTEKAVFQPRLEDVYHYIEALVASKDRPNIPEKFQVAHLKRYFIFIGEGVDPEGSFLHDIRRVSNKKDLFAVCRKHLLESDRGSTLFAGEPYPGIVARPNCES